MLPIIQIGHPTLRKKAKPLSKNEILSEEIQSLIKTMCDTMHAAPGVGLAAPQIDKSLQIIVLEDKTEYTQHVSPELLKLRERKPFPLHVLINPKIIEMKTEQVDFFEGCLSVAGYIGVVPRALEVQVKALNEKAEPIEINARGWYARILQHEIDHLQGTLCIDRTRMATFMTLQNYSEFWINKPIATVYDELNIHSSCEKHTHRDKEAASPCIE